MESAPAAKMATGEISANLGAMRTVIRIVVSRKQELVPIATLIRMTVHVQRSVKNIAQNIVPRHQALVFHVV